jgi:OOP family OmpA-OmpF porin
MEHSPALVATVIGHADTVGSAEFNEKLSQRRAQAVFDALVNKYNVPVSRVEMHYTGEREPMARTGDEKAEAANRTVDIVVR